MGSLRSLPKEGLVLALRKACMNLNMAASVLVFLLLQLETNPNRQHIVQSLNKHGLNNVASVLCGTS